jgi:hypothetical protein
MTVLLIDDSGHGATVWPHSNGLYSELVMDTLQTLQSKQSQSSLAAGEPLRWSV